MNKTKSNQRLILYVLAAVFASLLPDIQTLGDTVTGQEWASIIVKTALAAVVTARAYIDQSPAQIKP